MIAHVPCVLAIKGNYFWYFGGPGNYIHSPSCNNYLDPNPDSWNTNLKGTSTSLNRANNHLGNRSHTPEYIWSVSGPSGIGVPARSKSIHGNTSSFRKEDTQTSNVYRLHGRKLTKRTRSTPLKTACTYTYADIYIYAYTYVHLHTLQTIPYNTIQYHTIPYKTRQDKTRQDKTRHDKTKQDNTCMHNNMHTCTLSYIHMYMYMYMNIHINI